MMENTNDEEHKKDDNVLNSIKAISQPARMIEVVSLIEIQSAVIGVMIEMGGCLVELRKGELDKEKMLSMIDALGRANKLQLEFIKEVNARVGLDGKDDPA